MLYDNILHIALKIDAKISDSETTRSELMPLWHQPLLLEAFIAMLRHDSDFHRTNFEIIANLLSPSFLDVAKRLCPRAWPEAAD